MQREPSLHLLSNRLVGKVIIRQRRVHSGLSILFSPSSAFSFLEICSTPVLGNNRSLQCQGDLSRRNEESRSFLPRWMDDDPSKTNADLAFRYGPDGYVYECPGSVAELRAHLAALRQSSWIDHRTRLITIHLSLYNPNIRMFTSGVLQAEFSSTGSVHPTARFEPIDFRSLSHFVHFFCSSSDEYL